MRSWLAVLLVVAAVGGCGGSPSSGSAGAGGATTGRTGEALAAALYVDVAAGCARCHELTPLPDQVLPAPRGPDLGQAAGWWQNRPDTKGLVDHLRYHHGGDGAADLAAYVHSLGTVELQPAEVAPSAFALGQRLFAELACGACHAPGELQGLALRTDHRHLREFLRSPAAHRPRVAHDFALSAGEADALAAWLLAAQKVSASDAGADVSAPGFAFECFEMPVNSPGLPELMGREPAARGITDKLDVAKATRADHFVLRFRATLTVPVAGEWQFTCGSDDSSWLWIDDELVVRNEAIAPHRRRSGKVTLTAGPHDLQVMFAEAQGGESLEVLWRGPNQPEQVLGAEHARADRTVLQPPPALGPPDAAAIARGRALAAEKRCSSCHQIDDPALAAIAVAPARPFAQLGAGACPQTRSSPDLVAARKELTGQPPTVAEQLQLAMWVDGCASCHARAGRGGLPPVVAAGLAEVEDIGDEGRLPPDLTDVGHHLRGSWIERRLRGEVHARSYMKVRMPKFPAERAQQYAHWLAQLDGRPGDDDEPPFSAEAVALGRAMAGVGGRNCVTCHAFAGKRSLGPQGMDLALQHERLRPAWFREWVLAPTRHRPTTRMPPAWLQDGPQARSEIDAIWVLLSLGDAAPLPPGVDRAEGLVLVPEDRPILHGAFLDGLSARCIAVGSPLRTHYAFDVEHGRLAWLWRGDFVDAHGTWSGRAGQLLQPLGQDRVVLQDFAVTPVGQRRVLGRTVSADGHPVFRVAVGAAEYEDHAAPRLRAGGSEIVRTLRCVRGPIGFTFAPQDGVAVTVSGQTANTIELAEQEQVEVVYRW